MEVVVTTGATRRAKKAPVKSSPTTNQHPVFTGRMPFRSPNQQCQSTEGKLFFRLCRVNSQLATCVLFHQ